MEQTNTSLARVSRRSFLRYVYMGGTVASTTTLLGACTGASPSMLAAAEENSGTIKGGLELDIPTGPLGNIGALQNAGFDNIQIPAGFSIRRVATQGQDPLSDATNGAQTSGYNWHEAPDGGGVFVAEDGSGDYVYASNSEVAGTGCVGALKFDVNGNLKDAYRILDNTSRNCAGGETPWGTWMSCEENQAAGQIYETFPFGTVNDAVVKPAVGSRTLE
ncbi:MAG: DUF839 domain-containing protein, partial [Gammaproteobacteria bacterium]|nr:DUF839 domain-containing protein [Gammaproteobacteria bacterium]